MKQNQPVDSEGARNRQTGMGCVSAKVRGCELFGFNGCRLPGDKDTPHRSNSFSAGLIQGFKSMCGEPEDRTNIVAL